MRSGRQRSVRTGGCKVARRSLSASPSWPKLAQESGVRSQEFSSSLTPDSCFLTPVLALGASTGGPEALARVLAALAPRPPVPVLVVQHIAADFVPGFVTWLQGRTGLPVRLAQEGMAPEPGLVDV